MSLLWTLFIDVVVALATRIPRVTSANASLKLASNRITRTAVDTNGW